MESLAIGEDYSRIARILKVLDLPESVLASLRKHTLNSRVRGHFTEVRLRRLARQASESDMLREIDSVLHPSS